MGDGNIRRVAVILNGDKNAPHLHNVERAAELFGKNGYDLYVASPEKVKKNKTHHFTPTRKGVGEIADSLKTLDDDDELVIYTTGHGDNKYSGCLELQDGCLSKDDSNFKKLFSFQHVKRTIIMSQCYGGNWAALLANDPKTLFVSAGSKGDKVCCQKFDPLFFKPDGQITDANKDKTISWRERYAFTLSHPQTARTIFLSGQKYKDTGVADGKKEPPYFKPVVHWVETRKEYDNLISTLRKGDIAVVAFSAPWCIPCKTYKPKFKKLAADAGGKALFIYIPNGDDTVKWKHLSIKSYPSVFLTDHYRQYRKVNNINDPLSERWKMAHFDRKSFYINTLKHGDVNLRIMAAEALGQNDSADKKTESALIGALSDRDSKVRYAASKSLGMIRRKTKKVESALIGALSDRIRDVRHAAATALGEVGRKTKKVDSALIRALKDEDEYVRNAAAWALGKTGSRTKKVESALIGAMSDEDEYVRWAATGSLGMIGRKTKEVESALIRALSDSKENVRHAAAVALKKVGPEEIQRTSARIDGLDNSEEGAQKIRETLIFAYKNGNKLAVLVALNDRNPFIRKQAALTLWEMGSVVKETIPLLIVLLSDSDKNVRNTTTDVLVKFGSDAFPALIEALEDPNGDVRTSATDAIIQSMKHIEPKDRLQFVLALVPMLMNSKFKVHEVAINAINQSIEHLEPKDRLQFVLALVPMLRDPSWWPRTSAFHTIVHLIKHLEPKDRPQIILVLIPLLLKNHRLRADFKARWSGPKSIGDLIKYLEPKDRPQVISALVPLLKDRNDNVRSAAAKVLGEMGSAAKGAMPALVELEKNDSYENVVEAARDALKKIRKQLSKTQKQSITKPKNLSPTLKTFVGVNIDGDGAIFGVAGGVSRPISDHWYLGGYVHYTRFITPEETANRAGLILSADYLPTQLPILFQAGLVPHYDFKEKAFDLGVMGAAAYQFKFIPTAMGVFVEKPGVIHKRNRNVVFGLQAFTKF